MPPEPVTARRGAPHAVLVLATLSVVGLASGYLGADRAVRPLREAIATRPPVLIADLAGALQGVPPDGAGAVIARHREAAERLADGGVLVLDAQAVLAAPEDAYLRLGEGE